MKHDTPLNSRHYHRPVVTTADRVALAMAEGDTPRAWPSGRPRPARAANSHDIAERLGIKASYVRSTMARIRRQLGPQIDTPRPGSEYDR